MNTRTILICAVITGAALASVSWASKWLDANPKPVLTADTNHDGKLSLETLKLGQDLIIIKQNPAKLSPYNLVFQTKNFGLYTAASWSDLQNPDAIKNLLLGRVTKDGTLKVYTLPNLGYTTIQYSQKQAGVVEIYLLNDKGKSDRVYQINYPPTPFQVYDPANLLKPRAM